MDDIIFEEFKGTGNMEIHLDRKLSERRIFPSIDILKSGSRRDDLLLGKEELDAAEKIRKLTGAQNAVNKLETVEKIINIFVKTKSTNEFITTLNNQIVKK